MERFRSKMERSIPSFNAPSRISSTQTPAAQRLLNAVQVSKSFKISSALNLSVKPCAATQPSNFVGIFVPNFVGIFVANSPHLKALRSSPASVAANNSDSQLGLGSNLLAHRSTSSRPAREAISPERSLYAVAKT
jgi:hypothetical protein